jgi:hypothetical protein
LEVFDRDCFFLDCLLGRKSWLDADELSLSGSQQPAGGAVTAGTEGGGRRPGWQAPCAWTVPMGLWRKPTDGMTAHNRPQLNVLWQMLNSRRRKKGETQKKKVTQFSV